MLGIQIASALPRTLRISRLPIRGRARAIRGTAAARKESPAWADLDCALSGGKNPRETMVNRAEAISPIKCPYTARLTVISLPEPSHTLAMRNTAPMRITCSATWEKAGTLAFCMP